MRCATQVHKKRRVAPMTKKQAKSLKAGAALITPQTLKDASSTHSSRLCGDLSKINHHLANCIGTKEGYKHGGECAFCGEKAFTKCGVCDVPLHNRPSKGEHKDKNCFMDYHNTCFFGMAYADRHLLNKTRTTWTKPTPQQLVQNKRNIKELTAAKTKKAKAAPTKEYNLRGRGGNDGGGDGSADNNI